MKIAILTIGDELLNGDLADTNTAAIARILMDNSLPVCEAATVGDRKEEIAATLQRLADTHDAVIVTGGLGPTEDDRTAKAAASAFERPLILNDKALKQIRNKIIQQDTAWSPSSPAIDSNGDVYVGGGDSLHAISQDGNFKWSYTIGQLPPSIILLLSFFRWRGRHLLRLDLCPSCCMVPKLSSPA